MKHLCCLPFEIGQNVYFAFRNCSESYIIYKSKIVALFPAVGDEDKPNIYWIVCCEHGLKFKNLAEEENGDNLLHTSQEEIFLSQTEALLYSYEQLDKDNPE